MRSRSSAPSRVAAPWKRSNRDGAVSNLLNEVLLRLAKAGIALVLAIVLYVVLVGPIGAASSVELALLCWLSAAAFVLLVETGLI